MGVDSYRTHSPLTDPGRFAPLLDALPRGSVGDAVRIVQGLVVQPVPPDSDPWTDQAHLRFVADMLALIAEWDPRPLDVARPPAERVRGNCRNSATLLVALLRQQGVPARKRAGFARYIAPGRAIIHEIAEHRDGDHWVLVDPDVGLVQQRAYLTAHGLSAPADYGVVDLRLADGFVTGGEAWRRCRAGTADPGEFEGAGAGPGLRGVRQALLQDLDGLNRVELLSHDWWGGDLDEKADLTPDDLATLDRAAELAAAPDERQAELRQLYESSRGPAVRARVAGAPRPAVA